MEKPYRYTPNLLHTIDNIPVDSIVSRTIHDDEFTKVILFGFAKGQELSEHTASMPAIIHILQGEFQIILGEDEIHAQSGSWFHLDANLTHALTAKSQAVMLLTLIKNESEPDS